ncbi:cytochrome c oxidase subunit 3 [Spongiibacter taiwanensis]|uniref:cytochrome c oxidase subunit 3 n=1 Tax=Spongiibacter taiwanensis TaxID=1748242 RepID=UPI002035B435|nr:cytochrome c oxidase subunit 3 [Spongiibacter taiwanensis]USA44122.1 cytochrome c oxidase subunit 3 [Spongiibacter taiwanensis]
MEKTLQPNTQRGEARAAPRIPGEAGIWIFIGGDLIIFSVFFILIALGQHQYGEVFAQSRQQLQLGVGVFNTLLLLTGSWFVALGVAGAKTGGGPKVSRYISLGILCGVGFIANKGIEWGGKFSVGLSPMTNEFYMYFFMFTGIHLIHVIVGILVLLGIRKTSQHYPLTPRQQRSIETGALFWHLVDLLWIALFAMLYLL